MSCFALVMSPNDRTEANLPCGETDYRSRPGPKRPDQAFRNRLKRPDFAPQEILLLRPAQ